MTEDEFMSPAQIRYELLTILLAIKPSNTKASTIIKIMNEYYDAIMAHKGDVVEFKLYNNDEG
jgi:hypothetical protein